MSTTIRRRVFIAGLGATGASMTIKRSRAQDIPIKIGFVSPLSGQGAPVGIPSRIGAEVARDHINAQGGVNGRKIELVLGDDKASPAQAVSVVRDFASQGINLIIGPPNTATVFGVTTLLPELKCVGLFTGSPNDRLTHDLFNRNGFTMAQVNYMRMHAIARVFAQKYPNIAQWTGVLPDIAVGRDGWAAFGSAMAEEYPKIAKTHPTMVEPAFSKFGATDYKQQISALMASPATGMFNTLFGADGITFYQQAEQFGLYKKYKAIVDYGIDIDVPKTLKHHVSNTIWSICYWYYGAFQANPLNRELVAAFVKTGDPYPHGFASMGHTGIMAYAAAIKATGSAETDKVISYLEGGKFDSVRGTAYFRKEDHQLISTQNMVRWEPTDSEPGWRAAEIYTIPDSEVSYPPEPGKKQ